MKISFSERELFGDGGYIDHHTADLLPILKSLRAKFSHRWENEYGGYINRHTREIIGPFRGKRGSIVLPRLETIRWRTWSQFHTHPGVGGLSASDLISTLESEWPQFVITSCGIYELKPKEVWPRWRLVFIELMAEILVLLRRGLSFQERKREYLSRILPIKINRLDLPSPR